VAKKQYESIQVAVPRGRRIAKLAFASLFCIFGLAVLVGALLHKNEAALLGVSILAIGIIALITFKPTHESQLTEQGKALKAADDAAAARRTKQWEDAFRSLLYFVGVIGAIVYFAPAVFNTLGDKVRIYPIYCPSWDYTSNKCAALKWVTHGVRQFTVHGSQQIVIASYPDADFPPVRYYNCAVVDRLNWACTVAAEPDSAPVTMTHGVFVDHSVMGDPSIRYASRLRWWATKLSE